VLATPADKCSASGQLANRTASGGSEQLWPAAEADQSHSAQRRRARWAGHNGRGRSKIMDRPSHQDFSPELAALLRYRQEETTGHGVVPRVLLRRLTHSQHNRTVLDLLGDTTNAARQFPPEVYVDGFKGSRPMNGNSITVAAQTVYSDDTLCLAKHSMHFGPPLPNVGEGATGEGDEHTAGGLASILGASSRAASRELIQHRGIPVTPRPLSHVGERGADTRDLQLSHTNL
jgi:uncharacterized protein DUF1587